MLDGFLRLFSPRPWFEVAIDTFDILVVTYIVYRALLAIRGTRAVQMAVGLAVFFVIYGLSKYLGFVTLFNLLSVALSSIVLIIVVVFQNDIRRVLTRLGAGAEFGSAGRKQETRVIDEVVAAATELARHRMGALICFEQEAQIDEFVASPGTQIDSEVRRELLVGIFVPESVNRLHDGAVVVRDLRIASAGVFFPMTDTKVLDKSLGSRHRAAIGITEETDAVVVIVSEERGAITLCVNGELSPNLDGASLRSALIELVGQRTRAKRTSSTVLTFPPASFQRSPRIPEDRPSSPPMPPMPAASDPYLRIAPVKPARTMPPAKPIETPIASSIPPPTAGNRDPEDRS